MRTTTVLLGLLVASSQEVFAQQPITNAAQVYPLSEQGRLIGCQVGFSVLRKDLEYSDGKPALANGLIMINAKNGTVGLRLGIATDAELSEFKRPDRAYLFKNFKSNADDFVNKFESSDEGFEFFVFKLGDATGNVLIEFMDAGSIDILYAPPKGIVDARFTFDLGSQPKALSEFVECLSAVLEEHAN